MKRVEGGCPGLETIAAYLDGRLGERERARVTEHLTSCEECYAVFSESAQTPVLEARTGAAGVLGWRARLAKPRILGSMAAVLAAAAAVVLFVATGGVMPGRSADPSLQALVTAVGGEQMFEPRLTGGFAFGPVRGPVRAGEAAPETVSPDVRIAAARIEKEAGAHRTPKALKALGIAHLMMGDIKRAVPVLEEAADQPTPDAEALNDLAAAYLVQAARNNQPQNLPKALAMADRAVKADGRLPEAWFNRAYALERLSLTNEARQAWQDYLKIDDRSGWAGEARAHLRALGGEPQSRADDGERHQFAEAARRGDAVEIRRLVQHSPNTARDWLQEELLKNWSSAVVDGALPAAADALADATRVARELTAATGDRFMADAVASAASASPGASGAADLARGHALFLAATTDYYEDRISDSMKTFEQALAPLAHARSPFAAWTRYYLVVGHYYAGDLAGAARALEPVLTIAHDREYTKLLGVAHRVSGLMHVVSGELAAGLEEYRTAADCFERARDVGESASMYALLGEDLNLLGEPDLAWTELSKGLAQLPFVPEARNRHTILQDAALASLRQGLPEAALHFEQAALDNATEWARPPAILDAHMYRSEMQRQVGNDGEAMAELAQARRTLLRVSDPQLAARNEAQIQLAEGEVEWRSRPADAVVALSKALASFTRSKTNWPLVRVLLARGRAHLSAGREDLAEADFSAGIDVFEGQRASVANEALRSASFERPWDLFSEMIRFQAINRRRPDLALAFAERARARTLLEALSPASGTTPVDPMAARASLPSSVTMLYYAALDDRLLIWTLTRTAVAFVDTPIRHAELIHLLEQFRSEMAGNPSAARDMPSLTRLYDVLIRPVAGGLPDGSEVVIVPDGALNAVPFAALIRRENRRYLVEDRAVEVTPSLTMFLAASARRETHTAAWNDALVLGNPRIAGDDADVPADLPEAEAEARDVAALYPTATLLLGANATRSDFVRDAGRFGVVHFAGHAIANEGRPELSRLLMAGSNETSRSLFARDIAALHFGATELVVLGACRTSIGRIRRGEGVFNLARPFLAAGVPTVVASLWDVDDRASRRLLVAFHRALRQNGDVAEALRHAQLQLMGDADPLLQAPAAWAGFTVIGGKVSRMRPDLS